MAGLVQRYLDAGERREGLLVVHRGEEGRHPLGVLHGVERLLRVRALAVLLDMALLLELGVLRLQLGRVHQHDLGYLGGGLGAVYLALEAVAHQLGQQAAVVHVGVGQQQGVDAFGRDGERLPVAFQEVMLLVHAAVHHDALAVGLDEVLGTGDVLGGPQKAQA